ncbi:MAG: sigma-54 dependent transcriptional regulator [Holosporaceae bacterium]|jgi:two-component system nitrogen regulation response regulator NtrX|nr:sigma-54 dependent transcriptional regulator [Holosporaceae bacterium]
MSGETILIVDDEAEVRSLMAGALEDEGYKTILAKDGHETAMALKNSSPDLIFLDLWIGDDESAGLKILEKIKKTRMEIPVVMISGHGTIDVAVQAIRNGAFDFVEKPFVIDRLLLTCKQALEIRRLQKENSALKLNKFDIDVFSVGTSQFATSIKSMLEKIASANSRVFIKSKIGIGADALAYAIHKNSARKDLPFICVNCARDEEKDFDAKFFGGEKRYGLIEKADGGTLFLEDVAKLHANSQAKLLQFLQSGFYPAGSRKAHSDARIICSSNEEGDLSSSPKFSRELFYRLNVVNIDAPNLKDRREDILPIIDYYLSNSEAIFGLKGKKFTEDAIAILQSYDWPGNVYQLKNAVESSLIHSIKSKEMDKNDLPSELTSSAKDKFASLNVAKLISLPIKEAKEFFESDYLRAQLDRFSGSVSRTARFIGMERSALHRKLKALGVVAEKRAAKK